MSPKYMKYEPHQHFSQTFSIWAVEKTNKKQEVRRPSAQQKSILERGGVKGHNETFLASHLGVS